MTYIPLEEDIEHKVEVEDLQLQQLRELILIRTILQEMTGFEINKEDLDERSN